MRYQKAMSLRTHLEEPVTLALYRQACNTAKQLPRKGKKGASLHTHIAALSTLPAFSTT